ncbi:TIGR01777 family oxidoreductase [Porticoccus sp. W117]|uniref:TIGR01777 family oxidoreductase n=1 Tax=Porticoccus sp. W117 TaxID=3054777 RepID=UPI0025922F92|nr:TIGR01777 family oxidoreductase [Porticoccus sp. W117]MDM3870311.1 TIGR01777 family oxidoreductase [Porticoccus sp. W117]
MNSKQILITGGTGFIGKYLCRRLLSDGHGVHVISRHPDRVAASMPDGVKLYSSLTELDSSMAFQQVINLAGEPLAAGRWNERRKQQFRDSRIETTKQLYDFFVQAPRPPQVLLNGSAIGYYGPQGEEPLTEYSSAQDCFSHRLCRDWESSANAFASLGCRVCCLRIGVVLGAGEGALARMLPAFKMGLGGKLGSGEQWFSWVHIDDLVNMLIYCLNHPEMRGAVNGTAPWPVTNLQFSRQLACTLNRPMLLPMPAPVAKILFGEMAEELLLTGQRVVPQKITDAGFHFQYPELAQALRNLLGKEDQSPR